MAIEAKKLRYKIKCTRCDAMLIYDKEDVKEAKANLAQTQKELTAFCKETGLEKDYSRTKISK